MNKWIKEWRPFHYSTIQCLKNYTWVCQGKGVPAPKNWDQHMPSWSSQLLDSRPTFPVSCPAHPTQRWWTGPRPAGSGGGWHGLWQGACRNTMSCCICQTAHRALGISEMRKFEAPFFHLHNVKNNSLTFNALYLATWYFPWGGWVEQSYHP